MPHDFSIAFILGTRPEITKLAAVIQTAKSMGIRCHTVHTGQHYDHNMSAVFFEDLKLPEPDVFLGIGSKSQGGQTGQAIEQIEAWLVAEKPDAIAVVGDTNAGLSAAIAAVKLKIPVVHFEAGARSYDWTMPEEINRRVIDSIASVCFAPTQAALKTLEREGRGEDSWLIGDTLVETAKSISITEEKSEELTRGLGLERGEYAILTVHRAENTDDPKRLKAIVEGLGGVERPIVCPLHPRTEAALRRMGFWEEFSGRVQRLEPQPYSSFLTLLHSAAVVITDSGGVQQEAAIFKVPCLTLRDNTEWWDTIGGGFNRLVRTESAEISKAIEAVFSDGALQAKVKAAEDLFVEGASEKALGILIDLKKNGRLSYRKSDFHDEGTWEKYMGPS